MSIPVLKETLLVLRFRKIFVVDVSLGSIDSSDTKLLNRLL